MKYSSILALAALCGTLCVSAAEKPFRQTYPLDPAKVKANAERVAADLKDKPQWQKTILTYYAVPAMSDIRRLSDVFPTDGEACGTLNVIAAQGEYEPASFVIYPRKNVDKFELKVTDLTSKKGGKIPASEVDLKLIKIWYQSGQAWCGFFADCLTRTATNAETFVLLTSGHEIFRINMLLLNWKLVLLKNRCCRTFYTVWCPPLRSHRFHRICRKINARL